MSSVYITEPHTNGHVIFNTTHGPIDIHLWCNECPTIAHYFLQLCVDRYYNNMYFHRIIPNLLIQTGIVRSTDDPGIAIPEKEQKLMEYHKSIHAQNAFERRAYEVHSRIQFNHRGQVAMAMSNDATPFDASVLEVVPQFFITTDEAPCLNTRHVIFGTVSGPTIFNVIRINQYSNEGNDTIFDESTPRIIDTKIVVNPFKERMVASTQTPWQPVILSSGSGTKKKSRKGRFDKNVLSFGDDLDETTVNKKKKYPLEVPRSNQTNVLPANSDVLSKDSSEIHSLSTRREPFEDPEIQSSLAHIHTKNGVEVLPSELVENIISRPADEITQNASAHEPSGMSYVEARRAKYKKRSGGPNKSSKTQREEETYKRLINFRSKLREAVLPANGSTDPIIEDDGLASRMARRVAQQQKSETSLTDGDDAYHGQVLYSDDDRDPSWLTTKFKCRKHMDFLSGDGKDAVEEYQVIDSQSARHRHPRK